MDQTPDLIKKLCEADEDTLRKSMNPVADLYRDGLDLRTLIPVLTHPDRRVVECGAWIASEVVDGRRGREIFKELSSLLDHQDPAVRFWTIESIALLLRPPDYSITARLFARASDDSPGVRQQVLYWLCWLPDAVVEAAQQTSIWPGARLLLPTATKDDIRAALRSDRLFDQRMAAAGALRNFGGDQGFIDEITRDMDAEVVAAIPRLPRNREFA